MTLTLLDLYNTAATQEWSMYDNDAASEDEMEQSLVLALNKAIQEILYSYDFNFRDRTHVIFTIPDMEVYELPKGIIKKNEAGKYCVKVNSNYLEYVSEINKINNNAGLPEGFYIKGDKFILYPVPKNQFIVTIDYTTLAVGENSKGEEIFVLKNEDDTISIPSHLEELFKNAVIARAMLNSIASESDENFSAYKKQSETTYRLLVKYSKGVGVDKNIKF